MHPIPSGPITINYVYDPLNRLTEANYSNNDYYHYVYDAVGNRLTQETLLGGLTSATSYLYDDANRIETVNCVTYNFDANGNLLNDGVNTYVYDSANRLKTFTNATTTATYAYRCNGLSRDQWGITGCESDRVSQTVNGVTTNYTLDLASPLTQVLSDGTNTYVYGVNRIAQMNGTTPEYFLADGLGSMRQLVDSTGNVTLAKSYQPYGTQANSVGSGLSSYGFTGEMTDPTGLIYLRARYYASDTGRFISRDIWGGNYNRPLSLNRWNYVEGNPVNYTDPSGHCYIDGGNLRGWRLLEYPITGPCENDHHPDDLSAIYPHWHEYKTDNVVCPAYFACTKDEMIDFLSRFAYPGQDSSKPVVDQQIHSVFPFDKIYPPFGEIRSRISGLESKNIGMPTHIFYAGEVHRKAYPTPDGAWHVSTRGFGNNIYLFMDTVNQESGATIFNIVDLQMQSYIFKRKWLDYLIGGCNPTLIT